MDAEGESGDPWEYLEHSAYGVLTAHTFLIGYHHGLKEMCAASVSYDKDEGEYQEHMHAIRPTSFNGAAPNALTDLEKRLGRDLGESDKDMKLAIGYQFLHGRLNEGMADESTGGGDITMATMKPDRSISMNILATTEQCMDLARPIFEGKTEAQGKAQTPGSGPGKVSRNAKCPCGSGKKFKRCCGK